MRKLQCRQDLQRNRRYVVAYLTAHRAKDIESLDLAVYLQ